MLLRNDDKDRVAILVSPIVILPLSSSHIRNNAKNIEDLPMKPYGTKDFKLDLTEQKQNISDSKFIL